ncbi:hypothetical protein F0919_11475 [Taibaiella lutea]|uniref:Outer membrane protein beta-barrel domain-containing protein n=1 Tax=Taibaiella lutea TaxID=2608001 RepID=A0A5M6CGX0_9BACT|nr:hypothetical protein [Taibaiella lutea]KAA5533162.1 hypothetical protein F0919_11475 [Taibaiella lutea]
MKKIILLTAIALTSFAAATNAQEKGGFKLGVGPVAALPLGDFGDFYSFGVGGEVQASYGITDNIAGFVQAGYSQYFAKSYDFGGISIKGDATGIIPALVGARYHNSGFMVGAGIGYAKVTAEGAGGGFAYSPQIGYSFGDGMVDVIAHYTGITTSGSATSMVGLKVFINFLGK